MGLNETQVAKLKSMARAMTDPSVSAACKQLLVEALLESRTEED